MTSDLIKHDQGWTVTNDALQRLGSGRDQRLIGPANVLVFRGRRFNSSLCPELPREFAPKRPRANTAVIDTFDGVEIGTYDTSYRPTVDGKPIRAGDYASQRVRRALHGLPRRRAPLGHHRSPDGIARSGYGSCRRRTRFPAARRDCWWAPGPTSGQGLPGPGSSALRVGKVFPKKVAGSW